MSHLGGELEDGMDHHMHRPGTVKECWRCNRIAYEPGWYAALLAIEQGQTVVILEANGAPVR